MIEKQQADTQPNPGWGFICATCKHTYPDSEKYVKFPSDTPCKKLRWDRGGYDRSIHPPRYITSAPIFDLKRWTDGTETCPFYERDKMKKLLKYMTEPEIGEHLTYQLQFIKSCQTEDTIGSMLIIFQDDGITQYGATIDPETAPQALRELADRIEKRETVKR